MRAGCHRTDWHRMSTHGSLTCHVRTLNSPLGLLVPPVAAVADPFVINAILAGHVSSLPLPPHHPSPPCGLHSPSPRSQNTTPCSLCSAKQPMHSPHCSVQASPPCLCPSHQLIIPFSLGSMQHPGFPPGSMEPGLHLSRLPTNEPCLPISSGPLLVCPRCAVPQVSIQRVGKFLDSPELKPVERHEDGGLEDSAVVIKDGSFQWCVRAGGCQALLFLAPLPPTACSVRSPAAEGREVS